MGRHTKQSVDYFPHYVNHGKTLHIIQHLYGNDGYAFFYKLLELLADSEGHYYDCREEVSKEYLASKTDLTWISGAEIIQKLSSMGIIDAELWQNGVIWMESFVESVKDAYRKRSVSVPVKPEASRFLPPEMQHEDISSAGSTQSKVKESKVNNKTCPAPETAPVIDEDETVITPTMSEAIPIAQLMYDKILTIDPKFKASEAKLKGWAADIEKLIRLDARSPDEIKAVVEWVYQDQFWKGNILSGGKLREKFTQLLAQMQRKNSNNGRFTNGEDFRRKYEAGEI
jgi:hypothetical protein